MKKTLLSICALALAANIQAVEPGNANIYATGLKVGDGGKTVQFVANAPGLAKLTFYKGGKPVLSIEGQSVVKGLNVVDLSYKFPAEVKANDDLTWQVQLSADANESIKGFSTYASKVAELSGGDVAKAERNNVNAEVWTQAAAFVDEGQKMEYPYSIAVDNNPTSPNFGNIYVLNDAGKSYGSIERESGLYVYDSNLNLLNTTPYTNGLNIGQEYYSDDRAVPVSPYAVFVDEEGNVFISSASTENGGIYVAEANDVTKFRKLIETPADMVLLDFVVVGKGENKTLWVLNKPNSSLYKSVIGDMTAESYTFEHINTLTADNDIIGSNNGANAFTTYPARICSDKRGGFWVIEGNRQSEASGCYWLNHVNSEGVSDFGDGDYWGAVEGTKDTNSLFNLIKSSYDIDTNADGTVLTIAICGSIVPLGVSYDADNKPQLTSPNTSDPTSYIYGALSSTAPYGRWGNSLHPVTTGVAYDAAGNLYATDLSGYFQAFAPVKADNSYTTVANEKLIVKSELLTGVESTIADDNAAVEYFNMQGVKVNAPENGIFIKKQGGKAAKVIL